MKQDPELLAAVDEFEEDRALDQAEAEELARQLEEDVAYTDALDAYAEAEDTGVMVNGALVSSYDDYPYFDDPYDCGDPECPACGVVVS